MKQYCRYCAYCVYGDVVWCDKLDKIISFSSAKTTNHCKHFKFCEIDALGGSLLKKYKPREKKNNQSHNQLSLLEVAEQ
jgi:hypothetical protein